DFKRRQYDAESSAHNHAEITDLSLINVRAAFQIVDRTPQVLVPLHQHLAIPRGSWQNCSFAPHGFVQAFVSSLIDWIHDGSSTLDYIVHKLQIAECRTVGNSEH